MRINELTQKDTGRWVLYTASHGETEKGRIKSWNDKFIFVVFHCDGKWHQYQNYTGEATKSEDLKCLDKPYR